MPLLTEPYLAQQSHWPKTGRHILAQFDAETIVVYQAYRPAIGLEAAKNGVFGREFKFTRMSWIKPNFLWMMYRSGWGTKTGQEVILAVRLRRAFFDSLLDQAVASTWNRDSYASEAQWSQAVARSDVRLQWDPDHSPSGDKLERRAIQLGLRGDAIEAYGRREPLEILDISAMVAEQRARWKTDGLSALSTPRERVYHPADSSIAAQLRLDDAPD
jgi:hypothetical protein